MRGLALAGAAALVLAAPAAAAARRSLPGEDVVFRTPDGWTLRGKYQAALSPASTTFILLHGTGQRKELWHVLARHLSRDGYGWLAVDLRGHGESRTGPDGQEKSWRKFAASAKGANDFLDMANDVQAAAAWLAGQGIPEERVGLIGTEVGGSVALKYAAVHPKVPLTVLLSPGMSYREVTTVNAMRAYKGRPILLVYSELDKNSAKATPLLYQFARLSAGERNATVVSVAKLHGAKLPVNGPVVRRVLSWLRAPVKPEPLPEEARPSSDEGPVDGSSEPSEEDEPSEAGAVEGVGLIQ